METWVLLVTLVSGQQILAGQYQSYERCMDAAKMQRPFWIAEHKRPPHKMECTMAIVLGDEEVERPPAQDKH